MLHTRTSGKQGVWGLKMANASSNTLGPLESHVITASNPLPTTILQQIADAGALDEISNAPGAVRHHVYWRGSRNPLDNTLRHTMMFFIYQTTRYGPQNGFRLCIIYAGYRITSPTKAEDDEGEDDIDRLEKPIPQGHQEVVFLGTKPAVPEDSD